MAHMSRKLVERLINEYATPNIERTHLYTKVQDAAPFTLPWATFKRVYAGYVFKEARRAEVACHITEEV
jgi:hypothetical protein